MRGKVLRTAALSATASRLSRRWRCCVTAVHFVANNNLPQNLSDRLTLSRPFGPIHATLCREYGFTGSYSSVHRLIRAIRAATPAQASVALNWVPADAAQVDFGAGPKLADADGVIRRTWFFVMTLAYSRHQYVEFVWDQSVATWLGCHRRAFERFGAVPSRLVIDNASCAVNQGCRRSGTLCVVLPCGFYLP
jgi:transposase